MNFNLKQNEYSLQARMTDELINLYGILIKIAITEKINSDKTVFGDYSHIKTEEKNTFSIYAYPENSDQFDSMSMNFSMFGMSSMETINLFVSRKSIDTHFEDFDSGKGFKGIIGSIITVPSGKLLEITDIEFEVPGTNNMFTQANVKNVYKLSCAPYSYKENDEIENTTVNSDNDVTTDEDDYASLTSYFEELTQVKDDVNEKAKEYTKTNSELDSVFDRF